MAYSDIEKYDPCGRYKKCARSPACGDCKEWTAFSRLVVLDEIEGKIAKGITLEKQKEEARQVISSDNVFHWNKEEEQA